MEISRKKLIEKLHQMNNCAKALAFSAFYSKKDYLSGIDPDKIMFFAFQGKYVCNPKYISEKVHELSPDKKIVWVCLEEDQLGEFPDYCRTVLFASDEYFKEQLSSKVLVENAFNYVRLPVKKKKGQYYIQTMHGSLGIKRIGKSSKRTLRRNVRGSYSARNTDYIISNSEFEDMVYRTSFWEQTPILQFGHARNDILMSPVLESRRQEIRRKVRNQLQIDDQTKLALYAPTFISHQNHNEEKLDTVQITRAFENKYGGKWKIILRLHPRDYQKFEINNTFEIDGNIIPDIQELMIAVDAGITDYSSWIFDFLLTRKPGFIFAPDYREYEQGIGFYYPLEETPFPIAQDNESLAINIEKFDNFTYEKRIQEFLCHRGCIDDGNAAERIAEFILELCKKQV